LHRKTKRDKDMERELSKVAESKVAYALELLSNANNDLR
jgi:hypothetical protein